VIIERTTAPALWVAAAVLLAAPARAEAPPSLPPRRGTELHLDDALALSRRHNFDLLSAKDDSTIADAAVRTAREHPNPALSVITGRIHSDGGDGTELGNSLWERGYDSVLQVGQPVEINGERGARRRAAVAASDASRARLADVRRTLEAEVVQAYAAAALAGANERIARESAGYLRDEERIAEARWNAGDISRSDLDQIQIAAARLELDAQNATNVAYAQRLALETLLGMSEPDGGVVVADSLEALVSRSEGSAPAAPGGVRPDIAAAEADLRQAGAALQLERARRLPVPALIVQVEHEPPVRANTLGFGVALSLPLWNLNGGPIAAARASRDQAEHAAARARSTMVADVAAARAAFDEATARWHRYRDELRPQSETVRRSVSLAYEKGGASLLDLLAAQRGDNDVRLATMQAASDAVIAAARLRAATATIPEVSRR